MFHLWHQFLPKTVRSSSMLVFGSSSSTNGSQVPITLVDSGLYDQRSTLTNNKIAFLDNSIPTTSLALWWTVICTHLFTRILPNQRLYRTLGAASAQNNSKNRFRKFSKIIGIFAKYNINCFSKLPKSKKFLLLTIILLIV